MSVIERLKAAWMSEFSSSVPLLDLPHLVASDDSASEEQVRQRVERTIADCDAAAEDLERQLEQRRFVAAFLRDFIGGSSSPVVESRDSSRDPAPIAPVRLRRRARQLQLQAHEQVAQVSKYKQCPASNCW